MPVSVASALARIGADPWIEAERLAKLPREKATEALAALIERTSPARMLPGDAPGIAARLVQLLPSSSESRPKLPAAAAPAPHGWFLKVLLLFCLAYIAFAAFGLLADRWTSSNSSNAVHETSMP